MLKINFETKSKFKDLFLIDPKSDFLLILNNRIYPLHREALKQLTYFKTIIKKNCKVHVMQNLNDSCLIQNILGYVYGKNITIERNNSISKFLKISKLFGVEQLQNQIIQDIIKNYQEYGIFTALSVAIQYKIDSLQQKCLNELIALDFQQVIINKYDLLNSKKQIFKHVLIKHEEQKFNGTIKGLNTIQLRNIVREYQQYNQLQIQKDFIKFQITSKQNKNVLSQKDLGGLRQKKVLSPNMVFSTKLPELKKNTSQNSEFLQSKQLAKLGKLQYKEAQQLNELNKKMIREKKLFKSQLKSMKNHLKDKKSITSTIQGLEELQQKYIELKQVDCQQNKKLQRLKTSVNDYYGKYSQSNSIKNQNSCDLQQSLRQRRNSGFSLKKLKFFKL